MKRQLVIMSLVAALAFLGGCIVSVMPDTGTPLVMNAGENIDFSVKVVSPYTAYMATWRITDEEGTNLIETKEFFKSGDQTSFASNPYILNPGQYTVTCIIDSYIVLGSGSGGMGNMPGAGMLFIGPIPDGSRKWNVVVLGLSITPNPARSNITNAPGTAQSYKAIVYPEGTYTYQWLLDGREVSNTSGWGFTPTPDQAGFHILEIKAAGEGWDYSVKHEIVVPFAMLGGWEHPEFKCVQSTLDGGYIAVGSSWFLDSSKSEILIVKYDANGRIQWRKQKGSAQSAWASAVIQTDDGGYAVSGSMVLKLDNQGDIKWQADIRGSSSIYQTPDGGFMVDGWGILFKLDPQGKQEWQRDMGIRAASSTSDGGYILLCGYEEPKLCRLDAQGNVIWQKACPQAAEYIRETADGGYVTGFSFAIKLDRNGDPLWEGDVFRTTVSNYYRPSILENSDGSFVVACDSRAEDIPGPMQFNRANLWPDAYVAYLDSDGKLRGQHVFGEYGWNTLNWITPTKDGKIMLAGSIEGAVWSKAALFRIDAGGN